MESIDRTWRFGLSTRVLIGFATVFIFGMAAVLVSIPLLVGGGTWAMIAIVGATAIIMAGFGFFMTFGWIGVCRTKISIEGGNLDATVPQSHNWLLVPSFRTVKLPLAQIHSVQRRLEAFKSLGLTQMRESLSIVTAGSERIGLFSNTIGSAVQLPLGEIARAIASGAGCEVIDEGTVWTKASGLYGAASSTWSEKPLDAPSAGKVQRTAILTTQIALSLVLFVFVLRACSH